MSAGGVESLSFAQGAKKVSDDDDQTISNNLLAELHRTQIGKETSRSSLDRLHGRLFQTPVNECRSILPGTLGTQFVQRSFVALRHSSYEDCGISCQLQSNVETSDSQQQQNLLYLASDEIRKFCSQADETITFNHKYFQTMPLSYLKHNTCSGFFHKIILRQGYQNYKRGQF